MYIPVYLIKSFLECRSNWIRKVTPPKKSLNRKYSLVRCHYNEVNFLQNPIKRVRERYGMPIVYLNSDLYFASFTASMHAISCYIGPCYNAFDCIIEWLNDTMGPLLLTWFDFNPSMISHHMPSEVWDEITYPFLNFNSSQFGHIIALLVL